MMHRRFFLGVLLVAPVIAMAFPVAARAQDVGVGTWKLNLAKSKYEPVSLTPKSQVVRFEVLDGGGMKVVAETVDAQGTRVHTEVVTMFDGKASNVRGAADRDTRVYRRIDNRTYEFVASVNGKVTTTTRTVLSADGKTRTNTTTGKNAQGQTVSSVAVYDKQ
jgi:hypothetical protein